MSEQLLQHPDEESQQEKKPELKFEHSCPIDEIAQFISDVRAGQDRRMKLNPEQAVERIEYFLEKPNVIELILKRDEELIGCAFAYEQYKKDLAEEILDVNLFSRDGERIFSIREVDVKAEHRGKGFGRIIMERIMREANQKGATKLVLSTFPDEDNPAYQLYKKLGFKEVSQKQDPIHFYMSYEYERTNHSSLPS